MSPSYIGDTVNSALLFSELLADELAVLDIDRSANGLGPNFELVKSLSTFCTMPICYGGGISTALEAEDLFRLGVEKVSINSSIVNSPSLISDLVRNFGSQAVRACLDIKTEGLESPEVWFKGVGKHVEGSLLGLVNRLQDEGVGELMLTSVDSEGTWRGTNLELGQEISERLDIPVILNGGVGSDKDIRDVFSLTQCSGIGVSSYFIYQKKGAGVLVGIPVQPQSA
jgi:cyclase